MNPELMKFIELLLRQNVQFTVTSAFRTKRQNEACNGAENSQHLTGDAIDLKPVYHCVADFVSKIKGFPFKYDQIITYRTFVHVSFARGRNPRQMELNFANLK